MKSQTSQEGLQDDLANMASDISDSNFNVRQFKRQHLAKPIKVDLTSKQKTISKIQTENQTQPQTFYLPSHSKTVAQGLNRSLKFNDTFIPPRKRSQKSSQSRFKSQSYFSKSQSRYQQQRQGKHCRSLKIELNHKKQSKLQHYEREWSKGKVRQVCLPEWLNAICIQFFPNQYFDRTIQNSALKKLGIDENSLIAKGLKAQNVPRLYRGLFVFGMGFNELVNQLTEHDLYLSKIIWKIYSTVLEYCSKGTLETIIGDIERENALKLMELATDLEKKQAVIEKNDEINQKKNSEIFKEIKNLRIQNANLTNQKTVLYDQFNATEQAFSEEVNLRLKFQTKINQIYGLHRQLGFKHQKVYQQLVSKSQELKFQADKYFQVINRISEYKETQLDLKQQLIFYKDKSKSESEYLQKASKEIVNLTSKVTKLQYDLEVIRNLYQEIKVKEKQWEIERANMNVVIDLRQRSTKETHKEYQITLEQNNRLYISLSDQRKIMEQYQKDKKNYNSKIINILSENSYNKRKLQQINKKYDALQLQLKEQKKQNQELLNQNQIYSKNQESLKSYFDTVSKDITQMHRLNMTQSQELIFLKLFYKNMDKVLNEKNSQTASLFAEQKQLFQDYQKLKTEYNQLDSAFKINQQKLQNAQNNFEERILHLDLTRTELEEKEVFYLKKIKEQNAQLETVSISLEKILREYKNQKFERNALNNAYSQTLKIIESKNQEEKNLNVRLSLMEGELNKQKNNYLVLQTNMTKVLSDHSLIQQKLEEMLQKQRQQISAYLGYVHPMVVDDLRSHLLRVFTKNEINERQIIQLKSTLEKERAVSRQQLQRSSSGYRWEIKKLKVEAERVIQNLKNEITYQKDQNTKTKAQLQELQAVAETYRKKIHQKTTSQREEIYKFMIQEKRKQVDSMLAEMDKLQDQLARNKRKLADIGAQHEKEMLASHDQFKQSIEATLRKQITNDFEAKMKESQRSIRAEYAKKEQQMREDRDKGIAELSIEEFMRIKKVKPEQLMQSLSQKLGLILSPARIGKSRGRNRQQGAWRQMSNNRQDLRRRNELSRLLKNASDYYDQ